MGRVFLFFDFTDFSFSFFDILEWKRASELDAKQIHVTSHRLVLFLPIYST